MEQYKKLIATMLICKLLLCYIGRATCLSQKRCAAEQWPKMVMLVLIKYQNDHFFATVPLRVFLVKSMLLVLLLLSSASPPPMLPVLHFRAFVRMAVFMLHKLALCRNITAQLCQRGVSKMGVVVDDASL